MEANIHCLQHLPANRELRQTPGLSCRQTLPFTPSALPTAEQAALSTSSCLPLPPVRPSRLPCAVPGFASAGAPPLTPAPAAPPSPPRERAPPPRAARAPRARGAGRERGRPGAGPGAQRSPGAAAGSRCRREPPRPRPHLAVVFRLNFPVVRPEPRPRIALQLLFLHLFFFVVFVVVFIAAGLQAAPLEREGEGARPRAAGSPLQLPVLIGRARACSIPARQPRDHRASVHFHVHGSGWGAGTAANAGRFSGRPQGPAGAAAVRLTARRGRLLRGGAGLAGSCSGSRQSHCTPSNFRSLQLAFLTLRTLVASPAKK